MTNIEMAVQGNILTVKIDLSQTHGESTSGKSETIATTEGNKKVPGHDDLKIGINVFRPKK